MLVITRKAGEGVYVGENIFLKVLSIRGSQVRFGFDAPRSVIIIREEMKNDGRDDSAAPDVRGDDSGGQDVPPSGESAG